MAEFAVQPPMADTPPGSTRLLLLPTGQVLFTTGRANLQFLMPTDTPGAARGRRIASPTATFGGARPLTPPAREAGRDSTVQEKMFWRDLNEVHLLMDFMSGRPILFGVLGTLAGLMRSITAKVRESTLNPRDHRLSWSLIPLGAVAGLTVGLSITPNAGSLGFTTISSLSATALSFLAGYGAEGFFTMLDGVLTRIFPPTPGSGPAPGK